LASTFGLSTFFWVNYARADAIDATWLLSHVSWSRSPLQALCALLIILGVDYGLNVLVIALPAVKLGVPFQTAARDTIGLTLIAQIFDRVGMLACVVAVSLFRVVAHAGTTTKDVPAILIWSSVANFLTSGTLLWFLAKFYLTKRWHVPTQRSAVIATVASIVTNPAWIVAGAPFVTASLA
jgi:hypothetical protein